MVAALRLKPSVLLSVSVLGIMATTPASAASCDDLLPTVASPGSFGRPPEIGDIIGLRDIGEVDLRTFSKNVLAVSPDGSEIAFSIRRADPVTNRTCVAMAVQRADGRSPPRLIAVGGDLVRLTAVNRGLSLGSGYPTPIVPKWSPEGRSIAYLRADEGAVQVWLAAADGSGAHVVTKAPSEVRDFAWSKDGSSIIYETQPGITTQKAAAAGEGLSGFHYDDRFWPVADSIPHAREPLGAKVEVVSIDRGHAASLASDPGAALLEPNAGGRPAGAREFARSVDNSLIAWSEATRVDVAFSPSRLRVQKKGAEITCDVTACRTGIIGLWWIGRTLIFLREERDRQSGEFGLYRWNVSSEASPVLVERSLDVWTGCTVAVVRLICMREGSNQPRRIVSIDPFSGASKLVFDPNPGFAKLRLGTPDRLRWQEADGAWDYGDLVLPPGHRAGQRHPLIVVQYHSQGFLRGGTGDEVPIQLFANHGYAILVFEMGPVDRRSRPAPDIMSSNRNGITNASWRKAALHAVEAGVRKTIAMGVVAPSRVGITGLSDGASTVCYAMLHSSLFKAASASSGCNDPVTFMAMIGPAQTALAAELGFPFPGQDRTGFWADNSLAVNADRIEVPLLIQASDSEYRGALEAFSALRQRDRPIDLFIFPGEYHFKFQPAHRAAVYQRNLDWFDFWLNKQERSDGDQAQYARWRAMRALAAAKPGGDHERHAEIHASTSTSDKSR
jgi:dipeptidyl aminopeptidase/acylaminoacyl peptidase